MKKVILVNKSGKHIGIKEKKQAHIDGNLHKAFSIFIFNKKNELLVQKRSSMKYHSPNLWSNTCCSHPTSNEINFVENRLFEELGFSCKLKEIMHTCYNLKLKCGMIENEYNHIYFGRYDDAITINPAEVTDIKWMKIKSIHEDMINRGYLYTEWFKHIMLQQETKQAIKKFLKE